MCRVSKRYYRLTRKDSLWSPLRIAQIGMDEFALYGLNDRAQPLTLHGFRYAELRGRFRMSGCTHMVLESLIHRLPHTYEHTSQMLFRFLTEQCTLVCTRLVQPICTLSHLHRTRPALYLRVAPFNSLPFMVPLVDPFAVVQRAHVCFLLKSLLSSTPVLPYTGWQPVYYHHQMSHHLHSDHTPSEQEMLIGAHCCFLRSCHTLRLLQRNFAALWKLQQSRQTDPELKEWVCYWLQLDELVRRFAYLLSSWIHASCFHCKKLMKR